VLVAVCSFANESLADEGGSSFWQPGQNASFVAVPDDPGFSFQLVYFQRAASVSADRPIIIGGSIAAGYYSTNSLVYLTPSYTFATPVLEGQLAVSGSLPVGREQTSVSGLLSAPNGSSISASRTDSVTALGDFSPTATLKWVAGSHNFMGYITANVPTGYYSPSNFASLGLGRWALDEGAAYTFLSQSGFEASITAGITENFMNPSTQYQSGVDGHIDLGMSYSANSAGYVGIVGYVYRQLSGDTGPGARLGPFEGRVLGVGPQVGYGLSLGHLHLDLNLRAYKEFEAQNRPEGWSAWFTITASRSAK
jgi:hypothetical protein